MIQIGLIGYGDGGPTCCGIYFEASGEQASASVICEATDWRQLLRDMPAPQTDGT